MTDPHDDDAFDPEAPIEVPLGDELDLHLFAPREVGELVRHYLAEARAAGFREVRLVHGKGTGALRRTVEAELRRHPDVESFRVAGTGRGSWGATLVVLRPRE